MSAAGSSFVSSPHEPLAEKPLDLTSSDSADFVNARLESTALDYKTQWIACGEFTPACCIPHFLQQKCFYRMLFLYPIH